VTTTIPSIRGHTISSNSSNHTMRSSFLHLYSRARSKRSSNERTYVRLHSSSWEMRSPNMAVRWCQGRDQKASKWDVLSFSSIRPRSNSTWPLGPGFLAPKGLSSAIDQCRSRSEESGGAIRCTPMNFRGARSKSTTAQTTWFVAP
jgi:hypothetical protein